MAVLVSHAMHRFPTSPPDAVYSSYSLRGESGRRESGESALSRSMRYADPWLYGSGGATNGAGLVFAPAMVLCTCQDYVNGTKRSSKKSPSKCKKCKGTRLPFSPVDSKFGTVRCYPTSPPTAASTPLRAGTMRVTSSSRPSILPLSAAVGDPYDLMRRSRLAVTEAVGGSQQQQTQTRSVSPGKHRLAGQGTNQKSKDTKKKELTYNSTFGRRSILECDINPYELISSSELPTESKDASITLLNGQRIRVRPQSDEYEDVQIRQTKSPQSPKTPTISKIPLVSPSRTGSSQQDKQAERVRSQDNCKILAGLPKQTNENETDSSMTYSNRFKSILKKRATTFDSADSSVPLSPLSSPSPTHKSGSYFYVPMPPSTPRKKVQFLVENESLSDIFQEAEDDADEDDDVFEDALDEPPVPEEESKSEKAHNIDLKSPVHKLQRSYSERLNNEQVKVVFHDTMALRQKKRNDSRITFGEKDLERLDGITARTRKISLDKPRPSSPPPPPPPPVQSSDEDLLEDTKLFNGNPSNNISIKDGDGVESFQNISETNINKNPKAQNNHYNTDSNAKIRNKSIEADTPVICPKEELMIPEEDIKTENANKSLSSVQKYDVFRSSPISHDNNRSEKHIVDAESSVIETQKESKALEKLDQCIKKYEIVLNNPVIETHSPPPAVPPRKRSNSKQPPVNTLLKSPTSQTFKVESPAIESNSNKTIVQINGSTAAVHKLKIKNEYKDTINIQTVSVVESPQRKTSILINGDDCYSTVNVNDDVPLYQSSVVVKDNVEVVSTAKKSLVYITGNFTTINQPENYVDPAYSTQIGKQESKEEISKPVLFRNHSIERSTIKEDDKKDLNIKKFTKETEKIPEPQLDANCKKVNIPSSELLKELLRDPVEAVRRNLVPHVCGKSDMSRRHHDTKIHSSPNNSFIELPLEESKINSSLEESFLRLRNYETIGDDISSEHSSSTQYELMDVGSDCYTDHSNRSSITEEELANRTKFYELLSDAAHIEVSETEDHHYESIKISANSDPIYEEIEIPPPLPANPPPSCLLDDLQLDKEYTTRSIFEGASKYDILSYLVDAKERGIVQEDGYAYNFGSNHGPTDEEAKESYNRASHMSTVSDSSEDNSLIISGALIDDKTSFQKPAEVERNDSGVGSETSKSSLSKYRTKQEISISCEDCDSLLDYKAENEPLICRKCIKKRSERKEIITEIVETEEKYSKDLQIILEEFYQPMLVAGLLTPDQLSAIFLNAEELLENSHALAERLRDAVEIALEQGDDDLLTVNIGKLFLEAAPMLHGFETYCIRQGSASLLLASLEKDKELLRIFLRVSQMENTLLRRMNLNSFLMVPVQRVTKYPLLLARLYKVTPLHHDTREQLKEAQHKIELHLNHMNSETKDVPSKLWRRIGSNSGRRSSTEMDLVNIKLRKIAVDVLEWNHDEAKFALEGKLLFTQPTDNNWRKGRTIKLTPVNALLVINGKPIGNKGVERNDDNGLIFSRHSGIREAALLLVRDKNGRYSLLRDPLYLDRCVIAADPAWQSYFEVQELLGKDTFIFKAEDEEQTQIWYKQIQYHAQGMGAWRKRRNALANIMINGMGLRS